MTKAEVGNSYPKGCDSNLLFDVEVRGLANGRSLVAGRSKNRRDARLGRCDVDQHTPSHVRG